MGRSYYFVFLVTLLVFPPALSIPEFVFVETRIPVNPKINS